MAAPAWPTLLDLQRVPALRPLRVRQILGLVRAGERRRLRRGAELTAPGARDGSVWLVLEGRVELERRGRTVTLDAPVDLGLLQLLARASEPQSARAASRVRAIEVPSAHVLDVLDASPGHRLAVAADLADALLDRLADRPFLDAPGRDALRLTDDAGGDELIAEALYQLQRQPPTVGANVAELVDLAKSMERFRREPGEPIFAEPGHCCIVTAGTVDCDLGGLRVPARPGAHLGWVEAFADRPLAYEPRARTTVQGLQYRRTALLAALRHWPGVGRVVLTHLARALVVLSPDIPA